MNTYTSGTNRITCVVTNRAYVAQGDGPVTSCLDLSITRRINGAGEWQATFPDNDPRTQLLALKSRLARWSVDGVHVCTGIVEQSSLALSDTGERILTVSGRDMLGELAETPLGFFELGATNTTNPAAVPSTNVVQAMFVHMAGYDGTVWTGHDLAGATPVQTTNGVVASFAGESVLAGLVRVAEHVGEQFRVYRDGSRRITWLGAAVPSSGVRAIGHAADATAAFANRDVCFIQNLGLESDGYELLTRVYPYGGGEGNARLNIVNHTRSDPSGYSTLANAIANTDQETALGKVIGKYIEFKDIRPITEAGQSLAEGSASLIAAKNQLYDAGLAYLKANCTAGVVTTYRLSVSHIPDALDVGTTVHVIYQDDVYAIDTDLIVTEMRSRYGAGTQESHELIVSSVVRERKTDTSSLVGSLVEGRVFQAHPQANVNAYTTGYRLVVGDDQTTGKAELRFWFGQEVLQLKRALLRFNLSPIVSFTSTVGSDAEVEVGVTVSVSVSGEIDIPDHQHKITVAGSSAGENLLLGTAGGLGFLNKASSGDVKVNTNPDSGGVSGVELTGTGTGTGTGTIDLSSALSTSYGIFRASALNTYAIGDLEYSLNGGAWSALSGAAVLGANWYQLDLTASLYDANFRPVNTQNILEIRRRSAAATGKTAMMDAFLRVVEIIQESYLL